MDIQNWTRRQIRERIENSSMAGLVPYDFEIIGAYWIEFTPHQRFWQRWRVNRNWMEAVGCRVYAIPRYRKPTKDEWRCRLTMDMLDQK